MHTLLALVVPGYTHARKGHKRAAFLLNGILCVLLLAALATRWWHTPGGLLSFMVLFLGTLVWSGVDGRRRAAAGQPAPPTRREVILLAVPVWIFVLTLVVPSLQRAVLGVRMYRIPSGLESNAPTLRGGDRFMVELREGAVERGSLAIFANPEKPDITLVKRVVALEGDTVTGGPDGIHVNGILLRADSVDVFGPVQVPWGHAFALGDNVQRSRDSRHFGPFPVRTIKGRPLYVVFGSAWSRIGKTVR